MPDKNNGTGNRNASGPATSKAEPSKRWSERTYGVQVPSRMRHTEGPSITHTRGSGGSGERRRSGSYLATKVMSLVQSGRYEDALLLTGRHQRQALTESIYRRLWEDAQLEQQEQTHNGETQASPSGLPLLHDLWLSHCNVQTTAEKNASASSAPANDNQIDVSPTNTGAMADQPTSPGASKANPPTPATATASVLQDGATDGGTGIDEATAAKRRLDFATPARHELSHKEKDSSFVTQPTAAYSSACSIWALASLYSVDDFLRVVFDGPSSKLPSLHYGRLRSLYDSLCRQYSTTPNEVEFHAVFLTCGSFASEPAANDNETVRSIHHVLSTVAARRGDVGALELLLLSQRESHSPTKSLRDIDKAIWTLEEKLYVLYFLPLHLKPDTFLFLLPFSQDETEGGVEHDGHHDAISTWMRTRIQQTRAIPGLEEVTLALCEAAIHRFDEANEIKEIQQRLLSGQEETQHEQPQGQVHASSPSEPPLASAPFEAKDTTAPISQPPAPAEAVNSANQDKMQQNGTGVSENANAGSNSEPCISSKGAANDMPAPSATISKPDSAFLVPQEDAHLPLDDRLAAEQLKTNQLEMRVQELNETIVGLEEETRAAHEQLKRSLGGDPSAVQLPNEKDFAEDDTFGEKVKALEDALKREVQKRCDLEKKLKRVVSGSINGATAFTPGDVVDGADDEVIGGDSDDKVVDGDVDDEVETKKMNGEHKETALFPLTEMSTRIQGLLSRAGGSSRDWADFDDLLTSFMAENDELDGLDDEEKMIEHRDVVWFLNELKWRFDGIRSRCESDSAELQIQLSSVANLLEEHNAGENGTTAEWPTDSDKDGGTKELEIRQRLQALHHEYQMWRERSRSIMARLRSEMQQKDEEMERVDESARQKDAQIAELQAMVQGLHQEVHDTKQKSQALQEGAKVRLRYLESMIRELQGKMASAESGMQAGS